MYDKALQASKPQPRHVIKDLFDQMLGIEIELLNRLLGMVEGRKAIRLIGKEISQGRHDMRNVLKIKRKDKPGSKRRTIARAFTRCLRKDIRSYVYQWAFLSDLVRGAKRQVLKLNKMTNDQLQFVKHVDDALFRRNQLKNQIVGYNLRLVIPVAKRYSCYYELPDLIQEGNIGLMHAVDKFNPTWDYTFSTYAMHWIRMKINRFLSNCTRGIRLPVHLRDSLLKMRLTVDTLSVKLSRKPTMVELAEQLGSTPAKLKYMIDKAAQSEVDLGFATTMMEYGVVYDTLSDFTQADIADRLTKVMDTLTPREEVLLQGLLGLLPGVKPEIDAVAPLIGIGPDRAKVILSRVHDKLRHPSRTELIWEYIV